ncbi:MAG: T9SS type A sorting domain-containing protein, partial [bacterium]
AGDTLRFWCWYAIETDWDYAYVEVSTDGGEHYYSIPGNITTNYDPNGQNAGNGITGSSSTWVQGIFPLGAYADSTIHIRFRYWTDGATLGEGFYLDDVSHMQTFTASTTLSETITETHYDLNRPVGTYYYEVRAEDGDGQRSYLSQRKHLTVTGAGVPDAAETVAGLVFANPVRVGGKVVFSAPGAKGGTISVFDVAGRLVAAIKAPASGQVTWDLVGDDGRAVSAGIYFVGSGEGTSAARAKLVVLN